MDEYQRPEGCPIEIDIDKEICKECVHKMECSENLQLRFMSMSLKMGKEMEKKFSEPEEPPQPPRRHTGGSPFPSMHVVAASMPSMTDKVPILNFAKTFLDFKKIWKDCVAELVEEGYDQGALSEKEYVVLFSVYVTIFPRMAFPAFRKAEGEEISEDLKKNIREAIEEEIDNATGKVGESGEAP
jgi:hypothetical protein